MSYRTLYIEDILAATLDSESDTFHARDLAMQLTGSDSLDSLREYAQEYDCLINAADFAEYAQELAYDIGAAPDSNQWPLYCIDWEYAARELSHDYALVTYDGVDYYIHYV